MLRQRRKLIEDGVRADTPDGLEHRFGIERICNDRVGAFGGEGNSAIAGMRHSVYSMSFIAEGTYQRSANGARCACQQNFHEVIAAQEPVTMKERIARGSAWP